MKGKQGQQLGSGDPGRDDEEGSNRRWADRRRRGFTLLELLVVISILALLASLSVTVANAVMKRARLMQAEHICLELRKAVGTYSAEYGRYPIAADERSQARGDAEVDSGRALMDVLMAADEETGPGGLNSRAEPFFTTSRRATKEKPRGGVVATPTGGGTLYDPWGNLYHLIIDVDRNHRCDLPSGDGMVAKDVLVWSFGPDGIDDRGEGDDVVTW